MHFTPTDKSKLDTDGYLVLPEFMDGALLGRLRERVAELFEEEGDAAGAEFKQEPGCRRLANLVDKGDGFRAVIQDRHILDIVRHVLGPALKLSSLNVRSVLPHGAGGQPLHADMAAIADEIGFWVCNTVWMLDDYTPENGALRVVPGSHRRRQFPQDVLADPRADCPGQILITGQAGTVVVLNAHTWHAGTPNHTTRPRTSLHAFYCRRDKPQQQYQKQLLRPDTQAGLSPELRDLLALDDAHNDAVSATVVVRSGFMK